MTPARVLVTRPAREAARWVDELRAAGLDAIALPLIAIEPLQDSSALHAARARLQSSDVLMFVSAAAAEHFFHGFRLDGALRLRCWATGPGTTRALREAGVPASAIDAPDADAQQFDSEHLWALVRPQVRPGVRALIVRGGDADGRPLGRDWLAREITSAGGSCEALAAYRRLFPPLDDAARRLATEGAAGAATWLFSSSEAIGHLTRSMPDTDWRSARAVATHERIAQAARDAGFGHVAACRPALAAVVASIESLS